MSIKKEKTSLQKLMGGAAQVTEAFDLPGLSSLSSKNDENEGTEGTEGTKDTTTNPALATRGTPATRATRATPAGQGNVQACNNLLSLVERGLPRCSRRRPPNWIAAAPTRMATLTSMSCVTATGLSRMTSSVPEVPAGPQPTVRQETLFIVTTETVRSLTLQSKPSWRRRCGEAWGWRHLIPMAMPKQTSSSQMTLGQTRCLRPLVD